ncbi:uncharacterized protein LOC115049006 isoform X2 [Echeneis naucrates]|uniref:uncharacterized protein LOC115049006 isoform X2 n=1 Tax=Echeneis naucrates TaxID=173247 RepID=UPI001113F4D2|nr:uncharacterized protein LOC115049006 isoform X2 [Echeneis naucrates]
MSGKLVEELTGLLCTRRQLSRAAIHLLLVPQLRGLALDKCPGLVTSALCGHITARCQGLLSLDLSGAQRLPAEVLSETVRCLPALRSLSLAGMHCDRWVIQTIAHCCRSLQHLDVSHCHLLSPVALLPLGGGAFCSSSACPSSSSFCSDPSSSLSAPLPPVPLRSLLALDIGFGGQEGDCEATAAYLLLSLPDLQRVAIEGFTKACCLIDHREFSQTDVFTDREGVPRMNEVWRERRHRQGMDSWGKKKEGVQPGDEEHEDEEEEEKIFWHRNNVECEADTSGDERPSCSVNQKEEKRGGRDLSQSGDERLILRLQDVKGLTCNFLDSVGRLCPNIYSISVNADDPEDTQGRNQGSLLAMGLQTWSGQLRVLSVHFSAPLVDLLPALQVVGSSLVSLTMEGVKTSPRTPLLEVIKSCPRLRDLLISAEPPTMLQEEQYMDQEDNRDLPRLPNLCFLSLNFSYDHNQMKPVMSWKSLKQILKCLLSGSPLLEKLSLVSLPCPLDCVLQDVLCEGTWDRHFSACSTDFPPMPLSRVQHIDTSRTDVKMTTMKNIMQRCKRLKFVNLSFCWQISHLEWLNCKPIKKVEIVWM